MWAEETVASDSEAAGERWAPVGAVTNPEDERSQSPEGHGAPGGEAEMATRLRRLEEEHEQLHSSLLALTSHFAQVQFRLKQIVHGQSEEEDKEKMLKELEEFAFKGCPHVLGCRAQHPLHNSVRVPHGLKSALSSAQFIGFTFMETRQHSDVLCCRVLSFRVLDIARLLGLSTQRFLVEQVNTLFLGSTWNL